jgi:asparagine synthase (glutamine-hydrolysing)
VSRLAREHVTVALSGDGGDETLAGYSRYFRLIEMWRELAKTGAATKRFKSRFQHALHERTWRHLGPADPFRSQRLGTLQRASSKLGKRWCHWLASDLPDLQARDFRKCLDGASFVLGAGTPKTAYNDRSLWADVDSDLRAVRQFDYISYLTDGVLTKLDRASMAVSLEVRSPLLDTDVLGFAWSLPDSYLTEAGEVAKGQSGKRVLKDVLSRYVPRELIDRPKQGFGVPVGSWILGPLREWAEDQLSASRLEKDGIFEPTKVRQLWAQHVCGWANHSEVLWSILMFQTWLGAQR